MAAFTLFNNRSTAIHLSGRAYLPNVEQKGVLLQNGSNTFKGLHLHIATHVQYPFNTNLSQQKGWQKIVIKDTRQSSDLLKLLIDQPEKKIYSERFENPDCFVRIINVKKTCVSELVESVIKPGQAIDFLTIDLAGLNSIALKSYNWDKYPPLFIILNSANACTTENKVMGILIKKGYRQISALNGMLMFELKQ